MNKRKQSSKQNAPRRKQRVPRSVGPMDFMSPCAQKYALAICDPWNPDAQGACIPRFPARPSQKVTCFYRDTAYIGTAGAGQIMFSPTISNNSTSVFYTTAAYTGTTATSILTTTTGITSASVANLPYTSNQLIGTPGSAFLSPSVTGRIVSVSLRAQYTGTILNCAGMWRSLSSPDHENLNGINVGDYTEAEIKAIRPNNGCTVIASAVSDRETEYSKSQWLSQAEDDLATIYPYSNGNALNSTETTIGAPVLKIGFTGTPGESIYFEIVLHVEYVGVLTSGRVTPSHTDSRGFEMVQQAAARIPMAKIAAPNAPLKSLMIEGLREAAKALAPGAGQLLKAGVKAAAYRAGGYALSHAAAASGLMIL